MENFITGCQSVSHPHTCPVQVLRRWLTLSEISEGPLWGEVDRHSNLDADRLHANSVATIIKCASTIAGLDPARYSVHSLRSGMATVADGAPEWPSCARAAGRPGRWSIATSATGRSGRSALRRIWGCSPSRGYASVSLQEACETQHDGCGKDPAHDDEDHTPILRYTVRYPGIAYIEIDDRKEEIQGIEEGLKS